MLVKFEGFSPSPYKKTQATGKREEIDNPRSTFPTSDIKSVQQLFRTKKSNNGTCTIIEKQIIANEIF